MHSVPSLGFNISVGLALVVGVLALSSGSSPLNAAIKAGVALLVFGTMIWILSVALMIAQPGSISAPPPPASNPDREDQ